MRRPETAGTAYQVWRVRREQQGRPGSPHPGAAETGTPHPVRGSGRCPPTIAPLRSAGPDVGRTPQAVPTSAATAARSNSDRSPGLCVASSGDRRMFLLRRSGLRQGPGSGCSTPFRVLRGTGLIRPAACRGRSVRCAAKLFLWNLRQMSRPGGRRSDVCDVRTHQIHHRGPSRVPEG